jgi:hypothetical protein
MTGRVVCRILLLAALGLVLPTAGGGGPKLEGTYTHPAGAPILLDLKPGGKAAFTLFGERFACTYKVKGDQLLLDCAPKGEKIDFTIHGDGSLSGGALLGVLKKSSVGPSDHGTPDAAESADAAEAAPEVSGMEREAQQAALAEVIKHWIKANDGWITARTTGSSAAPIHFLRQFRELTVDGVRSYALSDSDRLNGFEWAGEVSFKQAPCREAGEGGLLLDGDPAGRGVYRQRGRWTQWVDFQPEPVHVQKVNGEWQVPQDTWLVRGTPPRPADFANAGVK